MAENEAAVDQAVVEPVQAEVVEQEVSADTPSDVSVAAETAVVEEPRSEEPPSLDAILEQHPHLRDVISQRERDRENAGAQRREAQLKREAGSREQTKANVERIAKELGINVEDSARLSFVYDLAQSNAAYELANQFPEALMGKYKVPTDAREQALERRESGDWDGYVTTLIDGAVQSGLDGLRAQIREEERVAAQERAAAELKAQQIKPGPDAPPPTSQGQPIGSAPGVYGTFAELAQAYNDGDISTEEYGKQRTKFVNRTG